MKKQTPQSLLTAAHFIACLQDLQSDEEQRKIRRYFKSEEGQYGHGDVFMGVKMGQVFDLAKTHTAMPAPELELLLESPLHEARAGAVSIMDKAARDRKTGPERRKECFDLYMRRHDRINNWDLVDLGCLYMTGSYLFDKPRDILYRLAASESLWERRTAIVSTCYFIRQGQTDDTFRIAELLLDDPEDLVHKGTGWMLRFAGDKDPQRLRKFLDRYAATMPRVLLRNCIEKMDREQRNHYLQLR